MTTILESISGSNESGCVEDHQEKNTKHGGNRENIAATSNIVQGTCLNCSNLTSLGCTNCRLVYFCSKDCQKSKWKEHKLTCSSIVELRSSSTGGLGVFARVDCEVGDELIRELPLIKWKAGQGNLKALLQTKDEHVRTAVMNFTDVHNTPSTPDGIAKTNSVPLQSASLEENPDGAIFPLTSRLNHSCVANATYFWRPDLGMELVFAQRPIMAGEEITVSYLGFLLEFGATRSLRSAHFIQKFKFACTCEICTEDEDKMKIRDARRLDIKELLDQFPKVAQLNPFRALKMSELVLILFKEEGQLIPIKTASVHFLAFQVAMACKERKKANYHITQCVEMYKLCEGDGSPEVQNMQSIKNKLKNFCWNKQGRGLF
eukprot:GHVP01063342.1.p1 GENE.GHVP01063342.1~~GHVP01063342.1.p1  ORF type:complete len:375 (-),score=24.76 GHVP01063342.1:59-1183(-)